MDDKSMICDCDAVHQHIVEMVRPKMPSESCLFDLADFFKVFADSTRIRILWALEESEMCVCDLASLLNMTKSAISHQLKTLRNAKLVKFRRDGKVVYYSLDDHHIKEILLTAQEHVDE
ncbi:metalloregulator ArsR/SmtB family transcription factor [Oscillospiraceae bacterium MB08-C2-2]|nr:metalloregulator ArsR/SmtB family transcription factor [Oscillospiraceae bacterium MB08-C2-2]